MYSRIITNKERLFPCTALNKLYLILYLFRVVVLHMFHLLYQLLHNNSIYCYMFRLTVVAIIRESLFTDMRSVCYVTFIIYSHCIVL
jgi:hypothetical protein